MIYFIQLPTGSIKVGTTTNLEQRMIDLEYHYKASLSLLHTMPGGRAEELAIHRRFAHLRLGQTEQFRPGPDLLSFIGKPVLAAANPDTVEVVSRGIKAVRLELPVAVYRELRLAAAHHEMSMAQLARLAVEEYISRDDDSAPQLQEGGPS